MFLIEGGEVEREKGEKRLTSYIDKTSHHTEQSEREKKVEN